MARPPREHSYLIPQGGDRVTPETRGADAWFSSMWCDSTLVPQVMKRLFAIMQTNAGATAHPHRGALSWSVTHAVVVSELVQPGFEVVRDWVLGRLEARCKLVWVAGPDDGGGDRRMCQYPGD